MWGSCVSDGGRGDDAAHSGRLWSVSVYQMSVKETMYPVNDERWDIEVMGFLSSGHLVTLDGTERRAEINEEEPGKVT